MRRPPLALRPPALWTLLRWRLRSWRTAARLRRNLGEVLAAVDRAEAEAERGRRERRRVDDLLIRLGQRTPD